MSLNLIILVTYCGKDNLISQIIFTVIFGINLLLAPFALIKIIAKTKAILNPAINKSYSTITIYLMNILKIGLIIYIPLSSIVVLIGIFIQFRYNSFESYFNSTFGSYLRIFLYVLVISTTLICDLLQITQIYEWLVILYFISF